MRRFAGILLTLVFALLAPAVAAQSPTPTPMASEPLVYHQITTLKEGAGSVGQPVLSGDGSTAIFTETSVADDAARLNRIYAIRFDGSEPAEVDAFEPRCGCGAWVDISFDGSTVVATDSMQLRLSVDGGEAVTLLDLTSNELSSLRITADGDRVFFLLARDTQVVDSADTLQRGIYAIDADGGDLEQLAGPDDLAQLLGITQDQVQMLRLQANAIDISSDGSRVVFGIYAGAQQAAFAMAGNGGDLHQLSEAVAFVQRVAMSGNGSLVALDVIPLNRPDNEVRLVPFGGGEALMAVPRISSGYDEPLQLNDDGSRLLISPHAYLVDTESGSLRQLAALTPGSDGHTALLTSVMARATMDAAARRFVYVFRTIRCADCPNAQEQLATLEIGGEPGDAPVVTNVTVDPDEIPLNYTAAATVTARVDATGDVLTVGMVALRNGVYDVNVGRDAILRDDGATGDAAANDGVYTYSTVVHVGAEARDDDTGPRVVRIQAESETADGRRHAVAVDAGTLTVVEE